MREPFILLNGDTLFEGAVLNRLLQSPVKPITVATHRKRHYDADDMKVALDGERLVRIGKDLDAHIVDAESIGMIRFRLDGPARFCRAVENALMDSSACKKWYLSVINEIAQTSSVWTCPINGYKWCEVDFPADLKHARGVVETCKVNDWNAGLLINRYATG
jgi:choline kinase